MSLASLEALTRIISSLLHLSCICDGDSIGSFQKGFWHSAVKSQLQWTRAIYHKDWSRFHNNLHVLEIKHYLKNFKKNKVSLYTLQMMLMPGEDLYTQDK